MASVEIMLRFKEKDRDKKNRKAAFTVAWTKFVLNSQAQKTTQERIIVERFRHQSQVRQPSLLRQSTQLLVSFTRKFKETGVESRNSAGEERDKVFYRFGGTAPLIE